MIPLRLSAKASETKARVLLVADNDGAFCDLIADMLNIGADEIEMAHSGKDALTAVSKGRYALVLVDFSMSDMCGWSLPWSIKADAPRTLVGMVTDAQDIEFMQDALDTAFDLIVLKPVGLRESYERPAPLAHVGKAV